MTGYAILAGFVLDLVLGDPQNRYHPVRWIGLLIQKQEQLYRRLIKNEIAAGAALLTVTTLTVYLLSYLLVVKAAGLNPLLGYAAHGLLVYFSLSVKSLGDAGLSVHDALSIGDESARVKIAAIVGRDTEKMTGPEITRAAVESVAEGSVDGVISVLFFAAIGGGPLAFAYKTISTCDSMVGYRTGKYELFGKISARADDAANFIPARLSIPLIYAASFLLGMDHKRCIKTAMRDRLKHPSPNSAHPEAAFAGALGIRLGGTSYYDGIPVEKPHLGEQVIDLAPHHIAEAVRLMRITSLLACASFVMPLF